MELAALAILGSLVLLVMEIIEPGHR